MTFSGGTPTTRPTQPKPPAGIAGPAKEPPKPAAAVVSTPPDKSVEPARVMEDEEEDKDAPFIEPTPTIINPAASRVGLTTAAKAAAEEALAEIQSDEDLPSENGEDDDSKW